MVGVGRGGCEVWLGCWMSQPVCTAPVIMVIVLCCLTTYNTDKHLVWLGRVPHQGH